VPRPLDGDDEALHVHAVIRLDRAMPAYRAGEVKPPPARFTVELLDDAVRATAGEVQAPLPDELGAGCVRWGVELDVRALDVHERREVAGYLVKYATKSTEQAGGVLHRVTEHELDALPVREHVRAYMREAFTLAGDQALAERRFGRCAHALGYRGHRLSKSRRYSTSSRRCARTASAMSTSGGSRARLTRRSARSPARPSASRASATPASATSQPPTRCWRHRPPRERVSTGD
jgi:hypothetical protein